MALQRLPKCKFFSTQHRKNCQIHKTQWLELRSPPPGVTGVARVPAPGGSPQWWCLTRRCAASCVPPRTIWRCFPTYTATSVPPCRTRSGWPVSLRIASGFVFLAAILDACRRKVVGLLKSLVLERKRRGDGKEFRSTKLRIQLGEYRVLIRNVDGECIGRRHADA